MKKNGFTLIELSIVLIIIGLIIGGILAGQELIKQARYRSIINEVNEFTVAINTFRLKYDSIPGDMPNAKTFWSGSGNGNGDGKIDYAETVTGNGAEWLRVWEHLSQADVIKQKFSYLPYFSSTSAPRSQISTSGYWYFGYEGPIYKSGPYNWLVQGILKLAAADMYTIDLKIDDGKASTGKFLTLQSVYNDGLCIDNNWSSPSANYKLDDPSTTCRLYYVLPF